MPATPSANERHYTEEPDDGLVTCPDCEGQGPWFTEQGDEMTCKTCDGTGYISAERAAEDAADDWGDQQMELARDRATGFEE